MTAITPSDLLAILGAVALAVLFGAVRRSRKEFGRDFALALVVPAVTLAYALDGHIGRGEGATLLMLLPNRADVIPRGRGLLLALYGGFIWATLAAGH
jgi:Ca2+/Na+ antiporter